MNEVDTRVLSGIQPTGTKHLGNYFGAIRQYLDLQEEFPGECFFFIADYHALTTVSDADEMRRSVFDLARTYLALGLDPDKALLFRQSSVPEVTELACMLSTVTGMGLLERAHSYKDKTAKGLRPSVGLFTYPVLQTADIVIYGGNLVPVGDDQVQHVEIAQDIVGSFNHAFSRDDPVLRRPEHRLSRAPKVPGTDGQKMSTSYGNTIPLFETGKRLRKIVGGIVTDSTPLGEPLKPEGCTVFELLRLLATGNELDRIETWYRKGERDGEPFGYGHAKQVLADHIEHHFAPARERMRHLSEHPEEVEAALSRSAERARAVARETVVRCREACGLD